MYQPQPQQQQQYPGSYYGPPIPPQQPYRQRSCFCCLFSTLIKAFIAFCIALGITVLILWLVFRPDKMKVAVENATLSNFTLTTSPNYLTHNLTADISIRNPNRKIGVYYDWLEADAFYDGYRFGWTPLPTFYQGHKSTTMVYPAFAGRTAIGIDDNSFGDFYNGENGTGIFHVDVWLFARVRYKFGSLITRKYTARVKCELQLPQATRRSSKMAGFSRTECDVVDF